MTTASNLCRVKAEPDDFETQPRHTALLVIDMQNDYCSPGGYIAQRGEDLSIVRRCIPPLQEVLEAVRETETLIIHTREGHLPDLSDCPSIKLARSKKLGAGIGDEGPLGRFLTRGSKSHDFIDELRPAPGEIVIDKPGKSAFFGTELEIILRNRGITHLVVTGVSTFVCVHTTLRDAYDRGFDNLILEDCCASSIDELHDAAIKMVKAHGGVFGHVSSSGEFLKALAGFLTTTAC